uniref:Uncharacterized protein n=1 Tax=Anguilla anguilla TaxID=7936 RepID=A0A0E9XVT9_ANGAN
MDQCECALAIMKCSKLCTVCIAMVTFYFLLIQQFKNNAHNIAAVLWNEHFNYFAEMTYCLKIT